MKKRINNSSKNIILPVTLILAAAFFVSSMGFGEITGNQVQGITQPVPGEDTVKFEPYHIIELGESFILPNYQGGFSKVKLINIDEQNNELQFKFGNSGNTVFNTYTSTKSSHFGNRFDLNYGGVTYPGEYDIDSNKVFLSFNSNRNLEIHPGMMTLIALPSNNVCASLNCNGYSPELLKFEGMDPINQELRFNSLYHNNTILVTYSSGGYANLIQGGISYSLRVYQNDTLTLNDPKFLLV